MVLADKLFDAVGIESYDLDGATERLKLDEDPEYQVEFKQYEKNVAELRLG